MAKLTESRQPRKQRKAHFNAPLHARQKFMTAMLSPDLQVKYGVKRLPVRKGDKVRILRGDFKGKEGNVARIDLRKVALYIDGITISKADKTPVFRPIHPSNVMIVDLKLDDNRRRLIIERRKKSETKTITSSTSETMSEGTKEKEETSKEGKKEE